MSHPARFSPEVLDVMLEVIEESWPEWFGRPVFHDPFAGTGERLRTWATANNITYSGTEIEACFIEVPGIMRGDSRDLATYPPARFPNEVATAGWVVLTSPVYPSGMSDAHLARDASRRKNYRKAKAEITGDVEADLEEQSMARFGYRGTKRPEDGGKSAKRTEYWRIARECVEHWQTASMVLVNVSDFKHSNGLIEPVVDDWRKLLHEAGWTDQTVMPVGTRRMRDGSNADQRVDHEVVIVGRRG
jgi:hypothetical protein